MSVMHVMVVSSCKLFYHDLISSLEKLHVDNHKLIYYSIQPITLTTFKNCFF